MASHFSSIGFPLRAEEEYVSLAQQVSGDAQVLPTKVGHYLRWTGSAGEELWLQVDGAGSLIGMVPHFTGKSAVRVGITERVTRPSDTSLDGAFCGWANPPGDVPTDGTYPFVFDLPDAATYADLVPPAIVDTQIAAFAHELSFYDSEDAFMSAQAEQSVKFAAKSFIPSGLFTPEGTRPAAPEAMAIFTGEVLESAVCRNDVTGALFLWALVDTVGGTYDVVADPELLPQPPPAGGVLSGTFWLSGRLQNVPPRKRSWIGKLFGGG